MLNFTKLEQKICTLIIETDSLSALETVRVNVLGKKSKISSLLKKITLIPIKNRKLFGNIVNNLKNRINFAFIKHKKFLEKKDLNKRLAIEALDITLPTQDDPMNEGRIHPLSQVLEEIIVIFSDMGFNVYDGPHIESDFYNFTALNIPLNHPARQEHDTFYLKKNKKGVRKVLRTQTSNTQIHTMEDKVPPIRMISPGRAYRCDNDLTHTPQFHQIEGLVIDKTTTLAHLKGTLEEFFKSFFEIDNLKMRFRANYFPFTQISYEVDIGYTRKGNKIIIGNDDKWLEVLGSGMVHRNILNNCNLNPDEYQGFAFGIGIDRIAMLKYGIPDLRMFFDTDLRWIQHYGFKPFNIPNLLRGITQ